MKKDFNLFISQLSETNATLDYFTDFDKVIRNTNKIAMKLNQLNYLLGKVDLHQAIAELYEENPNAFTVLDILIAVRTKDKKKTYLIETNFYNSGGSKLNEVARAYSDIAPKINQYGRFEFVWITDGQGWLSAKNKLGEAYSLIPSVYNLANLDEFLLQIKSEL